MEKGIAGNFCETDERRSVPLKEKPIIVILAIFFTAAMVTFTFVSRYTVEHRRHYVKTIFPEAQLVVPEKAVHINEKGSPCVFIVVQENTFLGEQPVADRIRLQSYRIKKREWSWTEST